MLPALLLLIALIIFNVHPSPKKRREARSLSGYNLCDGAKATTSFLLQMGLTGRVGAVPSAATGGHHILGHLNFHGIAYIFREVFVWYVAHPMAAFFPKGKAFGWRALGAAFKRSKPCITCSVVTYRDIVVCQFASVQYCCCHLHNYCFYTDKFPRMVPTREIKGKNYF
jgi:hypothetical protein